VPFTRHPGIDSLDLPGRGTGWRSAGGRGGGLSRGGLTHELVVDSLDLPLQRVRLAQRGDEELCKAVERAVQLAGDHVEVVRGVLLQG